MGVLIYEMCVKRTPFNPGGDSNVQDIFTQIAQTKVGDGFYAHVSYTNTDSVQMLLA